MLVNGFGSGAFFGATQCEMVPIGQKELFGNQSDSVLMHVSMVLY
jgi:hypothetical protein